MSQNSDHYSLSTSSSINQNIRRRSSQQQQQQQPFLSSSTDFNTLPDDSSPAVQTYTSPIVNDVCAGSQNGVRNASTMMKINNITPSNGNHFADKYAFTLEFAPPVVKTRKDQHRHTKSQIRSFNMATNDHQDLHSPFELDVPLCENQSLKRVQNDFLIDRMFKDEMNTNYTSQQQRSPNQSSYTNVLNHASPLLTPSSDHHDTDALSDAGTYIIEDDSDIAHDDEPDQDLEQPPPVSDEQNDISQSNSSTPFKRHTKTRKSRQGTFDIHALSSTTQSHTVSRPIVDSNVPNRDLSSSTSSSSSANLSSSSSLLSLPTESDNSIRKEPEGASHYMIDDKSSTGLIYARQRPNSLSQQQQQHSFSPPQNPIKSSECFVISPTFETKPFPTAVNPGLRRKLETQYKQKSTAAVIPTKDTNIELISRKPPLSPPLPNRSNPNETERYSFRLQQQTRQQESKQPPVPNQKVILNNSDYTPSTTKSTVRSQISNNDQISSSPFQRTSAIRQTMPANTQYNRPLSSSTTSSTKYLDDNDEMVTSHPSLTKVYMNKSFALRRQRSNLAPATTTTTKTIQQSTQPPQQTISKPLQTRQPLKPTSSVPSTSLTPSSSTGQTNRAVELRRARAQAKIEELAQRTRRQLQKTEQHNDIMSASWHSNASSSSRKDNLPVRSNIRSSNINPPKQDLLKTRTITSTHHRSSSASPNPLGESTNKTSKYRKTMVSSVTDESQYQRMNGSTCSEGGRCDSLRDDGQRLAIKLIQLSSGILAKLKPNTIIPDNDSNVRELEQLVDQLQTVNRTLSTIDASLNDPTSDEPFL